MRNLFRIWFRKNNKFTDWLLKEAQIRGYSEIEIDCEYQMVYFKDSYQGKAVFSPLTKMDAYFIRDGAAIIDGAFTKKDTVYKVYKDGSMSLVQTENYKF